MPVSMMSKMRRKFKQILSFAWSLIPQRKNRKSIPVLCYHSVNETWDNDIQPMKPKLFEQHLDFLKNSYHPISLRVWMDSILHDKPAPRNAVLITFDDGYADNYEVIFPLILARKIPVCIFVVTEFIQGNIKLVENEEFNAVTVEHMIKMRDSGLVSFGAHTCTHRVLSTLDNDEIYLEVTNSINTLNRWLGSATKVFAYPFGQYRHIGRCGIESASRSSAVVAFSTQWGESSSECNHYLMPRVTISSDDSVKDLSDKLRGKYGYLSVLHRYTAGFHAQLEKLGL